MKKFNCTPKPAMLRAAQHETWNPAGALAEIIDNSFGAGRGNANDVVITYQPKGRMLEILDNGRGMDAIGRLFQHGNSIGHHINDIGDKGAGGTKALLWLAGEVWIWTLRDGMMQHDRVRWYEWFDLESFADANVSDDWIKATPSNTPLDLFGHKHGTLIRLALLPSRIFRATNIARELAHLYSPGLRNGRTITFRTRGGDQFSGPIKNSHELVNPYAKPPSDKAKTINFDLVVAYGDEHLPVHGRITYDEDTPISESRVHIGFVYRIILSTTDCFQSRDGEEKFSGVGLSGWLDLGEGWQPYLSTTKDLIHDMPLYEALMQHVFDAIRPLLEESEKRSFDLEFDDLALGVEAALNDKSGDQSIKVGTDWQPLEPLNGGGGGGNGGGPTEKPITPEIEEPGGKGDKVEKEAPPLFQVAIIQQKDSVLEGALCRAIIHNGHNALDLYVQVNSDHELVQEALRARPPKRELLNLLIVDEIARAITEDVIKKLFRTKLALDILEIPDSAQRMRIISRQLVDRVVVKSKVA